MKTGTLINSKGESAPTNRWQFLRRGSMHASVAVHGAAQWSPQVANAVVTVAENLPPKTPVCTKTQGAAFFNSHYGLPSLFQKHVARKLQFIGTALPTGTRTPLQNLYGTITTNGLFFERHCNGIPAIEPEAALFSERRPLAAQTSSSWFA